jgi:hypothetical protein
MIHVPKIRERLLLVNGESTVQSETTDIEIHRVTELVRSGSSIA